MEPITSEAILDTPCFSTIEAAAIAKIPVARLQTWCNDRAVEFHTVEQGPRRLLRKFSGLEVVGLLVFIELIDTHKLRVADASGIVHHAVADVAFRLMMVDNPAFDPSFDR